MKMKLERLPFEFQGIWIHDDYGGWNPPLIERFKPEMHSDAKPPLRWVSRKELEEEHGRVEAVCVDFGEEVDWNSYSLERIVIWTEKFVLTVEEYDGAEYFIALPRNPPEKEEGVG
jgi:hypothetical protein